MRFKRTILACFVLPLVLAACGTPVTTTTTANPSPAASVATAPAAPTAQSTAEAATYIPSTAAPATIAAASATTAVATTTAANAEQASEPCAEGLRRFSHKLLTTAPICIPIAPKRVLALDMASLEMLLMNNQQPVATADWILDELPLLLPQYADTLKDLDEVGYPADLEKVAALHPDLILAPDDTIDVKLASAIAPVVVPDQAIYEDWKLGMQFWSEVLNVPDLYTKMEANYKTRVSELQAALGSNRPTVSVISSSTYGISLWMPDSTPGAILKDVGLPRPEAQSQVGEAAMAKYGEKQYVSISLERLDLADADAIFYFTYAATDPKIAEGESSYIKKFEQEPVWQALKAVKAKKAFFVPGHWWRSQTYLLANLVIDDLFTHLTTTKATTPVITGP